MKFYWAALILVFSSLTASAADRTISDFTLKDYLGAEHKLSEWQDKPVIVVAFLGTECPLAKLYGTRLNEIAAEYEPDGVQFIGINSNQQDTLREIGHYVDKQKIEFPMLKDSDHAVADLFAAERTPTVYILDQDRKVRYAGRIDDQFGVGYNRTKVKTNYLIDALENLLTGEEVATPETEAVGCIIGRIEKKEPTGDITYSDQISRLMQKHCVRCHREGQAAPFALTSYEETAAWAETMLEVIGDGRMPPWHANPEFGHFSNDAHMAPEEKQLFRQWVDNGMPEGDASKLPPPLKFTEGWQIAEPNQTYKMPKTYTVPPDGIVPYVYIVVNEATKEDAWVRAAEVRPGNYGVVHHAIAFFVPPEREYNPGDPLFNSIGTYAPGMPPMNWPKGYARFVPKGSKIIFQMHYTPNGTLQTDQSEVGLVYADTKEVQKEVKYVIAINTRFNIPAEDANYHVTSKYKFKEDMILHSLVPHMHLRGKSFRYTATYPDGKQEVLLDVPKYDFNWQNSYDLAEQKLMPKGTVVNCDAYFDNSPDNLMNPDPSKSVHWGDQSWDEMMIGTMVITKPDDEKDAQVSAVQ